MASLREWLRRIRWRLWVGPAGGAVAAISFFLPWGRFSFLMVHRSAAGHTVGGWAWSIFVLAVLVVVAGAAILRRWRVEWARAMVFGAALLGLLFFVVKSNELARGIWTPFGRLRPQDIGVKPGLGAAGTIAGFALALAGSFLLPVRRRPTPAHVPRRVE